MNTLFSALDYNLQCNVFAALVTAFILLTTILSIINKDLKIKNEGVLHGIIDIEIPKNPYRAATIVSVWKKMGVIDKAILQTRIDFLYLLIYPLAISLACTLLVGRGETLVSVGIGLSWAVLLCIPLDFFENIMILKMLSGSCNTPIPQITTLVATIKFILILLSLIYTTYMLLLMINVKACCG